jgi:hypothetical protein
MHKRAALFSIISLFVIAACGEKNSEKTASDEQAMAVKENKNSGFFSQHNRAKSEYVFAVQLDSARNGAGAFCFYGLSMTAEDKARSQAPSIEEILPLTSTGTRGVESSNLNAFAVTEQNIQEHLQWRIQNELNKIDNRARLAVSERRNCRDRTYESLKGEFNIPYSYSPINRVSSRCRLMSNGSIQPSTHVECQPGAVFEEGESRPECVNEELYRRDTNECARSRFAVIEEERRVLADACESHYAEVSNPSLVEVKKLAVRDTEQRAFSALMNEINLAKRTRGAINGQANAEMNTTYSEMRFVGSIMQEMSDRSLSHTVAGCPAPRTFRIVK